MAVYVDELRVYPNAWGPFRGGSCHLTADTIEELHSFAQSIGLRREWYQHHRRLPHYDLTRSRRDLALARGAVFIPAREQIKRRRKEREKQKLEATTTPGCMHCGRDDVGRHHCMVDKIDNLMRERRERLSEPDTPID